MGATYRKKNKRSWLVTVHQGGHREFKVVRSDQDAKELVRYIHKQELAGINVIEAVRHARAARALEPLSPPGHPPLRDAVLAWIERHERSGEIRRSTAKRYRSALKTWAFPFKIADGRLLGEIPVDRTTREMLGAVIWRVKEAGRSLAVIEQIRNPLKGCYAAMMETKVLPGPNPAADLKFFIGKQASKKRHRPVTYFRQEEGPQLVATALAAFPRWYPFILTGVIAGLRWGESAALYKPDIDWRRGSIHVARTFSEKGNRIELCKDGEDRRIKASPVLLAALRAHIETVEREGLAKGWTPEQRQLAFPNSRGRIVHHGQFVETVWRPLLAKAGLPYRKYHSTRHTYATWLLEDGADLRWVRLQMGHASIQETADTYGHCQPERHEAAVAGLDRHLGVPGIS
jgi:integrase